MTKRERQLALDVARMEQNEARIVFSNAKQVETSILKDEYGQRIHHHFHGLLFGLDEVFTQSRLLAKYAYKGVKLWLKS